MNGAIGLLYYDSVSDAQGSVTINVTSQSGINPQTATVDVQNRISRVEARLPAKLRFRPILMTSFAFILGVVPLAFAAGASSDSQRAIGTGVLGGMISATVLAVLLVPTFFVMVSKILQRSKPVSDEIEEPPKAQEERNAA